MAISNVIWYKQNANINFVKYHKLVLSAWSWIYTFFIWLKLCISINKHENGVWCLEEMENGIKSHVWNITNLIVFKNPVLSPVLWHLFHLLPFQRTVALWHPSPVFPRQTAAWESLASAQSILGKSLPARWSIRPGGSVISTSLNMCKFNHRQVCLPCFGVIIIIEVQWCSWAGALTDLFIPPQAESAIWCDA